MSDAHKQSRHVFLSALAVAIAVGVGVSCSGAPSGPAQGTPEWYYQAATENFAISDYTKTAEQLEEAMNAEGETGTRAMLWHSVLAAGLTRGYDELADAFVEGIEANEARAEAFQNSVNDYRRRTRQNAIAFSEGVGKLQALIDSQEMIALDFPLPPGNDSVSPLLGSVRAGNPVDSQIGAMEDQTLTRAIFGVVSELAGKAEVSKLMADAEAGGIQASSAQMAFGVARILLDISVMFDREGINDPRIRGHVFEMALKWGEPHYEHEEFAERVEEFKFDVENERRDMEGKRRMKKEDD